MRAATVRCTFHRPLKAAAGNNTSGGPSPGRFEAALRTDSAGVSAASAPRGQSVAAAGDDNSSRRRVDVVGASVCSFRRVVDVVGASASVQLASRLYANAVQCSRIAASEWRLMRARVCTSMRQRCYLVRRSKATNSSS